MRSLFVLVFFLNTFFLFGNSNSISDKFLDELHAEILFSDQYESDEAITLINSFLGKLKRQKFENKELLVSYTQYHLQLIHNSANTNSYDDNLLDFIDLLDELDSKTSFNIRLKLGSIVAIYAIFNSNGIYNLSDDYLNRGLKIITNNSHLTKNMMERNLILHAQGLVLTGQEKYDSALTFFFQAYRSIPSDNYIVLQRYESHISNTYFAKKNTKKAIIYATKSLSTYKKAGIDTTDNFYFACTKARLSRFYFEDKNYEASEKNALESKLFFDKKEIRDKVVLDYYYVLAKTALLERDEKKFISVLDELKANANLFEEKGAFYRLISDLYSCNENTKEQLIFSIKERDFNILTFKTQTRLNNLICSKIMSSKLETLLTKKKIEEENIKSKNVSIITSLLFVFTAVFSILFVRIRRFKNKRKLLEQSLHLEKIENDKNKLAASLFESRNNERKMLLTMFSAKLKLQKQAQQTFLEKINEIKKNKEPNVQNVILDLQLSITSMLQLDENLALKIEVGNSFQDFRSKLLEAHPCLSENEITQCSYYLLELSSKDISSIFNQTEGAIRTRKYKIKKKIGLSRDENLSEYLKSVSF